MPSYRSKLVIFVMPSNRNHPWEMNITKWDKGCLLKIWFVIHWFYFFGESLWKVKETDSRWKLNRRIDARFELDRGESSAAKNVWHLTDGCKPSFHYLSVVLIGSCWCVRHWDIPFDTYLGMHAPSTVLTLMDFQGPREYWICLKIADFNTTHRMCCIVVPQWIPDP